MAKAKTVAYLVTNQSTISYNGKIAACGDIVTDLPGESISWLLADGFITPSSVPNSDAPIEDLTPVATPVADAEIPADTTPTDEVAN